MHEALLNSSSENSKSVSYVNQQAGQGENESEKRAVVTLEDLQRSAAHLGEFSNWKTITDADLKCGTVARRDRYREDSTHGEGAALLRWDRNLLAIMLWGMLFLFGMTFVAENKTDMKENLLEAQEIGAEVHLPVEK